MNNIITLDNMLRNEARRYKLKFLITLLTRLACVEAAVILQIIFKYL